MKKVKILGTALAAIVGISGAVAKLQNPMAEQPFKKIGDNYHRIVDYNPDDCNGAPTACYYLIDDTRNVIPVSEYPNAEESTEQREYTGPVHMSN